MRVGSLGDRGYELLAVCGPGFNPGTLPEGGGALSFREDPVMVKAALAAARRARVISYVERGILPSSAIRDPESFRDPRDERSIHLLIRRGNCLHGLMRCQFHRHGEEADSLPLFADVLDRNGFPDEKRAAVCRDLQAADPGVESYLETSGWLKNPDFRGGPLLAIALPAATWALGSFFHGFAGIATLRASNGAARMMEKLGAVPVMNGNGPLIFHDAWYRGEVQLMRLHSRTYSPLLRTLVEECAEMLEGGVMVG